MYVMNMDLVSVTTSAILSALLFVVLEFTVILPLFTKIVKKATNDMVATHLLPAVTSYIDDKITSLKADLADAMFQKFRAFTGGRKKGINAIMNRLANGESLEDIEDEYQESTIDQVLSIVSAVADRLPRPSQGDNSNGKKKEDNQQEGAPSLLQLGSSQENQA